MNDDQLRPEVVDALAEAYRSPDKTVWLVAQVMLRFSPKPTKPEMQAARDRVQQEGHAEVLRKSLERMEGHDDDL